MHEAEAAYAYACATPPKIDNHPVARRTYFAYLIVGGRHSTVQTGSGLWNGRAAASRISSICRQCRPSWSMIHGNRKAVCVTYRRQPDCNTPSCAAYDPDHLFAYKVYLLNMANSKPPKTVGEAVQRLKLFNEKLRTLRGRKFIPMMTNAGFTWTLSQDEATFETRGLTLTEGNPHVRSMSRISESVGRFSGDHHWPVLGDPRGPSDA